MQCTAEVIIHRVHAQKICKIVDFVLFVQNHRYISRRLRRYSNKTYSNLINNEISIKELNKYPLILQSKGSNTREFLDDFAKKNNTILKANIELASYSLVVEFAKIGLGIGYATKDYIKEELRNKQLYEINLKEKIPSRYIGIAKSNKHLPNFSTKKLIEIIMK